jgi:hypothetical protein
MKPGTMIGLGLVLLGCVVLAVGRITYTTEQPVAQVGPVKVTQAVLHSIALPDVAGLGLIVAGGLMVLMIRRKA